MYLRPSLPFKKHCRGTSNGVSSTGCRATLSSRRPSPQETDSGSEHLIFGAPAGRHGNVGRMRATRDDLASWSSTCHHDRLVVTFYESTATSGYDGTRVTSFTRCCNCPRFRKPRYFRPIFCVFSFSFFFLPSSPTFTRGEFRKRERKRERESKLILSGSKCGFDGFWGKFLFYLAR